MDPSVTNLLAQVNTLGEEFSSAQGGGSGGEKQRAELRKAVSKLSLALEEPGDVLDRVAFQFLEVASIKIGINLGLFQLLVKSKKPRSLLGLAKETGADPVLLGRILRLLASFGAVEETDDECYAPTTVSKTFVVPKLAACIEHCFTYLSPIWNYLPKYLEETNYQNPSNISNTAFNLVYRTAKPCFQYIMEHHAWKDPFNLSMSGFDEGRASWMDIFPVEQKLSNGVDNNGILFVDVGGGLGHEALALKKRFPKLPGKLILQDLPQTVQDLQLEGVEVMAHDFLTPQTVKGARVYYFRNVLHDWNDDICRTILTETRRAMEPSVSRLLINQWVVPARNATRLMTAMDLNMMSVLSAMERTEKQWYELLESSGLRIKKIWRSDDDVSECLIEAVVKE
ncbi:hypothetical protein MMC34_007325 [Xylographa carneopallida]|nr:hypothetical protein [Xylographa carneopallida]